MSIVITPIPSTIDLTAPAFTLGTTNTAGAAVTAVSSNSTLLAFDASNPAAVAASAAVGSATVAARRDHGHVGVATITSTDNAIARFDSTAGALQNYTSNALLASDAGVVTLGSGQITWPDAVNASADPTTLDDYEEGDWTPQLWDTNLSNSENQEYNAATNGVYTKIGDICHIQGKLWMSSLGDLAGGAGVHIGGLPFVTRNESNTESTFSFGYMAQMNFGVVDNSPVGYAPSNVSFFYVMMFGDDVTQSVAMPITEWSLDGFAMFGGFYKVKQ